jgi:hypothetical protein
MSDARYMVDKLQHTVHLRDWLLVEYYGDTTMAETLRIMIGILNERIGIYENGLRRCRVEYYIETKATKYHSDAITN